MSPFIISPQHFFFLLRNALHTHTQLYRDGTRDDMANQIHLRLYFLPPPLCVSIWIIFIFKGNKKRRESVTEGTKWQGKVTCSKSVCWLHKRERDSHVYNIRMWLCRFESSDLNKVNNVTRRRFINQFQLSKWFVKRWGVMAIFYLV